MIRVLQSRSLLFWHASLSVICFFISLADKKAKRHNRVPLLETPLLRYHGISLLVLRSYSSSGTQPSVPQPQTLLGTHFIRLSFFWISGCSEITCLMSHNHLELTLSEAVSLHDLSLLPAPLFLANCPAVVLPPPHPRHLQPICTAQLELLFKMYDGFHPLFTFLWASHLT